MLNVCSMSLASGNTLLCIPFCLILFGQAALADQTMLTSDMHHLRSGTTREWSDFPETSEGPKLTANFRVSADARPQTLGLRRVDIKEKWQIAINGRKLVDLFSDENDMYEVYSIPSDYLVDGDNTIVVEATSDKIDDVRVGEIWIDTRSKDEILNECTLDLKAFDEEFDPIACRFTILKNNQSLAAIGDDSDRMTAIRSGVVYSGKGSAKVGLMPGKYTVYCGRGFEYSLGQLQINLAAGEKLVDKFFLRRQVDTTGYVACDTHVHTFEVSRHGDASLEERMLTLAGEGIEVAVATDHNIFVDYTPIQAELGLQKYFKPIIGNEVTTKFGHFNAFAGSSAATLPDQNAPDWRALTQSIHETAALQYVIINHPRDLHSNFRPFGPENMIAATGRRLDGRVLEVDAMELINSAALQSDPMVLFHDWMTQVNRGNRLSAVGSSDSHEVSMKIVGQGRTYIRVNDTNPAALAWPDILAAMYGGKMLVSLGLFMELRVEGKHSSGDFYSHEDDVIDAELMLRAPHWAEAEYVELYANGVLVEKIPAYKLPLAGSSFIPIVRFKRPAHDVQLVAIARGHSDAGLAWPIAKPYQPTSPDWKPYLFASSGIVRVDCDGDGKWTSANHYASAIVDRSNGDLAAAINELKDYDITTATFFAEEWSLKHGSLREESARTIWQAADKRISDGIQNYLLSERASAQR